MIKNGSQFVEILRVLNCLCLYDFEFIWGEDAEHFWNKFWDKERQCSKPLNLIFQLDSHNQEKLFQFLELRVIEQKSKL